MKPPIGKGLMLSMLDDEVVVEENQDTNIENTETLSIENKFSSKPIIQTPFTNKLKSKVTSPNGAAMSYINIDVTTLQSTMPSK